MGKLIISTGPFSIPRLYINYQRLDQDFVLIAMVTWTLIISIWKWNEMDAIAPEAGEFIHEQGQWGLHLSQHGAQRSGQFLKE